MGDEGNTTSYAWWVYDTRLKKMPAPEAGIFDYPRVCVPINVEWRAHVMGAISRLEWADAWDGDDDEVYRAIQEILKLYDFFQNGRCEAMLRQSPDDVCVWQQSLDGGETWEDVFNTSLCLNSGSGRTEIEWTTVRNESNTTIQNNYASYAGDITNVTNNWGYGDAQDINRDAAMCYAIGQFVDMICDVMKKLIDDKNAEFKNGAELFAAVESGLATVSGALFTLGVVTTATGIGAVALAATAALTLVIGYTATEGYGAFDDDEAKSNIKCRIYRAIAGSTPTFAAWQGALSQVAPEEDNTDILNNVVDVFMDNEDLFIGWLIEFDDVVTLTSPVPNLCLDCPDNWIATADFEALSEPAYVGLYSGAGVWTPGVGYSAKCFVDGTDRTVVSVQVDAPAYQFARVEWYYDHNICGGQTPAAAYSIRLYENSAEVIVSQKGFGDLATGENVYSYFGDHNCDGFMRVGMFSCYGNCGGNTVLSKVIIHGSGNCPFDGASGWEVSYNG